MKTALVVTRCECQASLGAELDEKRTVVRGFARDPRRRRELTAPANATSSGAERFDVGWLCPFCTRNTLRSFSTSGLSYREASAAGGSAPSAPAPA